MSFAPLATPWSTGSPTISAASKRCPSWRKSSRATSAPSCRRTRPHTAKPFADILADVDRVIMPGITHWQSPNFFAFFPSNTSGPAILGDLLSSGLGVQGMLWLTSPACTELETHVMDWLVEMLALPEQFKSTATGGGVIQDSASSAVLTALLAARERATGFAVNRRRRHGASSSPTRLRRRTLPSRRR
jgi:glutamate/tyrosine decarboxylase-like PLP-dependent enzyme